MKFGRKDYQERIIDTAETLRQEGKPFIPVEEPVFLLRAQDIFAARVVRFWAAMVAQHDGDPRTVEEAMKIAEDMDKWPTKKKPDSPEEV